MLLKRTVQQNLPTTSSFIQEEKNIEIKYKPNQWSPRNPYGKRTYERDFLLRLQYVPSSLKKPSNLPSLDIIKNEPVHTGKFLRVFPELSGHSIQQEISKYASDRLSLASTDQQKAKSIERKFDFEENNSDHLEEEIESLLEELVNDKFQETEMRINKLACVASLSTIISEVLESALENTSGARVKFGSFLGQLIACGTLTTGHLNEGFRSTLQCIEEHRLIVPKVPEYLGEIIGQMMKVTPDMMLLKDLLRPCIPSLAAGRIVASALKIVAEKFDKKKNLYLPGDLWRKSGCTWEEFLPDIDVSAFIIAQGIEFILPISRYYLKNDPKMKNVKRAVESLILSGGCEHDMFYWIKENVEDFYHNHEFFFILASCVLEYVVFVASNPHPDYSKIRTKFKLLTTYSYAKNHLRAESIHACECIVKKLNEPEGLFLELLRFLYRENFDKIESSISFNWWKVTHEHKIKMQDIMNGTIFRRNSVVSRPVYVDEILLQDITKPYSSVNVENQPEEGGKRKTVLSFPSIFGQIHAENDRHAMLARRKFLMKI